MKNARLGSTEIIVNKTGFGALPIQRIDDEAAEKLLWMAIDAGINFFDLSESSHGFTQFPHKYFCYA